MKMHVVVAAWLMQPETSGAGRRLISILRAIAPMLETGEEVTVLHPPDYLPDDPPAELRWQPIDIPRAPLWRRVLGERRLLRSTLEARAANLLELGSLPVPPHLPCPVSLTIHDTRDLEGWRRRPRTLVRRVLRQAVRRAARVTVPSAFTSQQLTGELGVELPIQTVPNGIDETFLRIRRRRPDDRPYFLHVGHLEPRKNLMMLLSAYAGLFQHGRLGPDQIPALVLAGADAGERTVLGERAAMLNLVGHVHFLGAVSELELLDLYAAAAALVLPSKHEGFGLPALEAMAVGLPVLVSDCGALPEVVSDFGYVLPADDPAAWTAAMIERLEQPEVIELVGMRRRHAARFTWAAAGRYTLETWRELCQETAV